MLSINNGWQGQRSKQPLETGERRIAVGSTPLTDLRIVTGEGAVVRGRLELEEDPKRQAGGGTLRAVPPPRISIYGGYEAAVQADGTFEFRNVSGLRKIEGLQLPFNRVIKSVEAPPNIRVGEYLDFAPMSAIENLKVIATIGGQLRGTVSGVDSASNRERNVLLLPALPTDRDYRGRDFYGFAQVFSIGDTCRYAMDKIQPGLYLVVAVDISVADLTADSNVMEQARAAAVPVDITPGFSNRTLELSMTRLQQYVVAPREIQ